MRGWRVGVVAVLVCGGCARAPALGDGEGALTFGAGTAMAGSSSTGQTQDESSDAVTPPGTAEESGTNNTCGDGVVDDGEQCDLGDENAPDGLCTPDCTISSCGDGFIEESIEECDDGNADNTDACLDNCREATCGDGEVQAGVEGCDDGNTDDTDACGNDCALTSCGDGETQAPEECDDANDDNTDACLSTCLAATCGDGFVRAGVEGCDDGENGIDTDDCLAGCVAARCGDGVVHAGVEECDDANVDDTDACISTCVAAACGDGFIFAGTEECDDGGTAPGDGCDDVCALELLTFSRDFVGAVAADAADCMEWTNFRGALLDDHTAISISGTFDGAGRVCTGPEATQLCDALRTGTALTIDCDGFSWHVGDCIGIELTADNAACMCQTPGYAVRPCINHVDWGGANSVTCSAPSQTLTVSCGYE